MTRRSRIGLVLGLLALAAWWGAGRMRPPGPASAGRPAAAQRTVGHGLADALAISRARIAKLPVVAHAEDGDVTIAGHVIDLQEGRPVGSVEVVFRSASGEASTMTGPDGAYAIRVAAGMYRAFVRDDTVLSVGRAERVRLPGLPSADDAGVPDEALMAIVVASHDTDGVDLSVVRGGIVAGHVVDRGGRPVAGAVLRARGFLRPALATDIAESEADGSFELRLPAGSFHLEASHPRFAGIADEAQARISVAPGDHQVLRLTLAAGCIVSGRVVGRDGKPAGEGAIERQFGPTDLAFLPAGRIEADGTFRWVTTEEADVTLRAWPWKSPRSPGRQFACRDGGRFEDVVFSIEDRRPDISGVLVDRAGAPVGNAYVDLAPFDPDGLGQQERTDEAGRWEVYHMPPGRYQISAQAEGRGIVTQTITSPSDGVRLVLGGTGRIEGTAPRLASGSFELVLRTCRTETGLIPLPQSSRLVTVAGGRFTIDDLPACELSFVALWHGRPLWQQVSIPGGGAARVELDLGPPRARTITGIVRDGAGRPVAGATVTATFQGNPDATTTTGATGAYTLKTFAGAIVHAERDGRMGEGQVGGGDAAAEQVDLDVEDAGDRAAGDEIED